MGGVSCLTLSLPAAIFVAVFNGEDIGKDQSKWILAALLVIVLGYLAGGAQAGYRATDMPFLNGAVATLGAFAIVQAVGVVRRLITGEGVSFSALVFNGLLASSIGVIGAWFGTRRATRKPLSEF